MKPITFTIITLAVVAGCVRSSDSCADDPFECDVVPCSAASGDDIGGSDSSDGSDGVCTPWAAPEFIGQFMLCFGEETKAEHCVQSAAGGLGITDYQIDDQDITRAVKYDFQPIHDVGLPGLNWWSWPENYLTAVPGVITHEDAGEVYAGYASRGCCAQLVVDGTLSAPPHDPACSSGIGLQDTPNAWCLPMLDDTMGGLCVFPCDIDNDCPNPAGEFCDLSRPDPYGLGDGVCRYKSMPNIPTPEPEIGE